MIRTAFLAVVVGAAMAGSLPAAGAQSGDLPDGCARAGPRGYACAWQAVVGPTTTDPPTFDLPRLGAAVLNISLRASGPVQSHHWMIVDREAGLIVESSRQHRPSDALLNGPPGPVEFLFLFDPERAYDIWIMWETLMGSYFPPTTYHLTVNIVELTGSLRAGDAAGSALDPQLRDGLDDGTAPETDLIGGWLDDPVLDDGLLLAGLQVAALAERRGEQVDTADRISYRLGWEVLGDRYEVYWSLTVVCPIAQEATRACPGATGGSWAWKGLLASPRGAHPVPVLADLANGTLTTIIPEAWIGSPQTGDLFTDLQARVWVLSAPGGAEHRGTCNEPTCRIADEATSNVRPFGMGGPSVWRALRGEVDPAAVAAPWYRDPLAPDNAADVLQVAGAGAAVATFLVGLLLVRRRRERLARLLDDVDAVLEVHADDPQAALKALSSLERRFDTLLREGKILEGQHAVLLARIERAGYRLVRGRSGEGGA